MITRNSFFVAAVLVATVACGAEPADDDSGEDADQSSDALTQGGCPASKIREWQAYCRTNYCPSKGMMSRGIDRCIWISEYTQKASCICR